MSLHILVVDEQATSQNGWVKTPAGVFLANKSEIAIHAYDQLSLLLKEEFS
jgi:hypothetical protein